MNISEKVAYLRGLAKGLDVAETKNGQLFEVIMDILDDIAANLTEIEDYAIHELGMQKPRSDQLYYISSSDATDTAVVLDQNAAEPLSLADRLGDFFSSIVEYFR